MLELFYKENLYRHRNFIAPNTVNLNDRMREFLNTIMTYFINSNTRVRSEHILYRLMINLGLDYNWSNSDIVYHIDTVLRGMLRPLDISSEVNINLIHPKSTIIKNANELIYYVDEYSNIELLKIDSTNWIDLQPIKFLNHNFRDLYFNHPTRINTVNDDLIVYKLDIKVLGLMFKYYCKQQVMVNLPISIGEFIGRYVLTNSLISMADISILNNYLDKGSIYINNRHTVGTTSVHIYHKMLDDIINKSLISRNKDRLNIIEVLKNIWLLDLTGYERLLLPKNLYETSRSKKFISVFLLDFINHITNYIKPYQDGNSQYYTDLKYYLKALNNLNITTTDIVDMKVKNILEDLRRKI